MGNLKRTGLMIVCVSGCIAVGAISAAISPQDAWYATLHKPTWMPPGWLFGIVWTVLYAVMGVALSFVLSKGWTATGVKRATFLFAMQLLLNAAWSPIFFRFHSPGLALADIVALWLLIGWTVAAFWSVRDIAGVLLMPYWVWVTFAVALNGAIWRMNP